MAANTVKDKDSALRVRAGVGFAGMFVVACFGAALFFMGQSNDEVGKLAQPQESAQFVQVADAN